MFKREDIRKTDVVNGTEEVLNQEMTKEMKAMQVELFQMVQKKIGKNPAAMAVFRKKGVCPSGYGYKNLENCTRTECPSCWEAALKEKGLLGGKKKKKK